MSAVKQVIAINENEVARPEDTQAGSVPVPVEIGDTSPEFVRALRRRLPDERRAITHHFSIAGQEGYLTVGVYDDGFGTVVAEQLNGRASLANSKRAGCKHSDPWLTDFVEAGCKR